MRRTASENNKATQPYAIKKTRLVVAWVLVIVWAGFIFFMSANTGSSLSDDLGVFSQLYQQVREMQESLFGSGFDVLAPLAHFFEYLIFAVLMANLLCNFMSLGKVCLLAIMVASLWGVTDEFHQYFVPGRMSDPLDWMVDTLGASVGAGIFFLLRRRAFRLNKTQAPFN